MGQKVNPHTLRVGLEVKWESQQWYDEDDSKYLDFIVEESDSHTSYAKNC